MSSPTIAESVRVLRSWVEEHRGTDTMAAHIDAVLRDVDQPRLGLATTAQLLEELEARLEGDIYLHARRHVRLAYSRLTAEDLAYRTVGSE